MITLKTSRQFVESFVTTFLPYIQLWKKTKLINVINQDACSDEYLSVVALNSVLDQVEEKFKRKLFNNKSQDLKFEFSNAEGAVFYKTLLNLPLDKEKPYHVGIVTSWIQLLDGQFITNKIHQGNRAPSIGTGHTWEDYFQY